MKKQYPILNNPLTRLLAILWCDLPDFKKKKYYRKMGWFKDNSILPHEPANVHPYDFPDLHCIEAYQENFCGERNEYKAFIADMNFHRLSAKTNAELKEYRRLVKLFGIHFYKEEHYNGITYTRVKETINEGYFWYKDQLPKGVKPILLMCNGSRVRGYWQRTGDIIELYRPNPNSADVYHPLPWRLAYRIGLCYV